jgi:hypothetical protein
MVTLTYPLGEIKALDCKGHLKAMLLRMRRDVERRKANLSNTKAHRNDNQIESYFWFVEFTKNGMPHFHVFTTHRFNKSDIAKWWSDVVSSDNNAHRYAGTRTEKLRSGRGGTIVYARKYAKKQEQKELPAMYKNSGIGRWWGIVGSREVVVAATYTEHGDEGGFNSFKWRNTLNTAIELRVNDGTIRKTDFDKCDCYVCDDVADRIHLFGLLNRAAGELENERKVLQQTKQNETENLYRKRRG